MFVAGFSRPGAGQVVWRKDSVAAEALLNRKTKKKLETSGVWVVRVGAVD